MELPRASLVCGRSRYARPLYRHTRVANWRCRTCAGLAYDSQRMSTEERHIQRARKFAMRAGAGWVDADEFPKRRPHRMHRATFARLRAQWTDADAKADESFFERVSAQVLCAHLSLERTRNRNSGPTATSATETGRGRLMSR